MVPLRSVADAESRGAVSASLLMFEELEQRIGVGRPKSSSKEMRLTFGEAIPLVLESEDSGCRRGKSILLQGSELVSMCPSLSEKWAE